ncbi:hypothetical protein OF83DRAFT_1089519 [Amylostereum chailletii]|nr:hypothetical protein OF83DRAFT_1089519 [Amylostereum chailletii]
MPPEVSTSVQEEFEVIPGNQYDMKCRPCSQMHGQTKAVKKTSMSGHRHSNIHQRALETSLSQRVKALSSATPLEPLGSAHLSVAPRFANPLLSNHNQPLVAGVPRQNPLDSIVERDGGIYDTSDDLIVFSAGDGNTVEPEEDLREKLAQQLDSLVYYDHTAFAHTLGARTRNMSSVDEDQMLLEESEGDLMVSDAVAAMEAMGLDEDSDEEEDISEAPEDVSGDWAPHGTKTMFMLDLLDNLPWLRMSDDQLKAVMWVMQECGVHDVPGLKALRSLQARLTREVGVTSELHISALGHRFFVNQPEVLFKLDWANPLVRPHVRVYPEISQSVSESWQAGKWVNELPDGDLSPMWAKWEKDGHRHYYVGELAQLQSGTLVIPHHWITIEGVEHFQGVRVIREVHYPGRTFTASVDEHSRVCHRSEELVANYRDLLAEYQELNLGDSRPHWIEMPNPLREIAKGKPMFTIWVLTWGDDVSGNRSKSYNVHTNVYLANASLPHLKLQQEFFVCFSSTSQHASCPEQFTATFQNMRRDAWQGAYDCQLKQEILFRVFSHALPADNPQQAESASVVGSAGNKNCRFDKMGGTEVYRETADGYHEHFDSKTVEPRMAADTLQTIKMQYDLATLGVAKALQENQSETGVKDKIAEHWIQQVLSRARERQYTLITAAHTRDPRLNDRHRSKEDKVAVRNELKRVIQQECLDWVYTQPSHTYSLIPVTSRMFSGSSCNPKNVTLGRTF